MTRRDDPVFWPPPKLRHPISNQWRAVEREKREAGDLTIAVIDLMTESFAVTRNALVRRLHDAEEIAFAPLLASAPAMETTRSAGTRTTTVPMSEHGMLAETSPGCEVEGRDKAWRTPRPATTAPTLPAPRPTPDALRGDLRRGQGMSARPGADARVRRSFSLPLRRGGLDSSARQAMERGERSFRASGRSCSTHSDAFAGLNAALQLEVAERQQALAEREQELARLREERARRGQHWVGVVTAVVVGSALIATIYGAEIALPWTNSLKGTAVVSVSMVLVAFLTMAWLARVQMRPDPPREAQRTRRSKQLPGRYRGS